MMQLNTDGINSARSNLIISYVKTRNWDDAVAMKYMVDIFYRFNGFFFLVASRELGAPP